MEPAGIAAVDLEPAARDVLDALLSVHLDRLPAALAARENARLAGAELHFAWEGPARPGTRHYYRLQAPDLLIEYDNTSADGNHAHTVLRRPLSDFGDDLLGEHRRDAPHPPA
jgi:hypothetical protein